MELKDIKSVYFLGAGGIGMSALVRYFLSENKFVAGYDRTPSELTERLIAEGAHLHFEEEPQSIPDECRDKDNTLVIYTPAIPQGHKEWEYFKANGFVIKKRAEVLGIITRHKKGLCIAGTHGKTTTSTMTAHLLHQSHVDCAAFLGGISKNYKSNLILSDKSDLVVIEADEYDRSFLHLSPQIAVITSADPDHLDIYGNRENYLEAFAQFTENIREGGTLIIHEGLDVVPRLQPGVNSYTYGRDKGDFHAQNIRIGNGRIIIDYVSPWQKIDDIELGVPVSINIENGIAAMAVAEMCGATAKEIADGMKSFAGADRRFDFHIKEESITLLSDYAHHPDEIKACARSMKELYRDRKISVIFQPHLYSRTNDFYKEFAASLSLFDEVILLDIYPAREQPIEGVTSKLIYDLIESNVKKSMCSRAQIIQEVEKRKNDFEVLVTLGAGDLDNDVPAIAEILKTRLC
ncbi:MAG: UDP-N-acetylmuramate--L-alanine ligase [Bacteroidaceae bacterium]|nr:UDP-N-acetylmuramate--L-alanine ligase [Bacteroidaceae bacterium]MBQ3189124.1 UDP-N-acetylmuramate--L-alanine ligase [Bacteroidaceae bacterium]